MSEVRVAQSLVFCVLLVDHRVLFSFGHCILSPWHDGYRFPLLYVQTIFVFLLLLLYHLINEILKIFSDTITVIRILPGVIIITLS